MTKRIQKLLSWWLVVMMVLTLLPATVLAAGTDKGTPSGAPAAPAVTHNAWNGESDYQITFNIWWGTNATAYELFENDVLIDSGDLEANSPNGQSRSWSMKDKANGTYVYKLELSNSYGKCSGSTVVTVRNGKDTPEQTDPAETTEPEEQTEPAETTEPEEQTESAETTEPEEQTEPTDTSDGNETVAYAWKIGNTYKIGDIVSYNNVNYECRLPHTALDGWQPPNVPALWQEYTGEVKPGEPEQPTEPTEPTEPTDPTEPVEPTEPEGPAPMPSTSPLPDRVLTGYWQNFINGATPLKLGDVPETYDIICISFADATSKPGEIVFNLDSTLCKELGGYTVADFKADVNKAHEKNQKVIIAIGGEVGNVIINSDEAAKAFADSAWKVMQEYGFDGVDVDLEHGIDVPHLSQALKLLAEKAGDSFILTMAPQTMDIYTYDATYLRLAREVKDILTIMNTQYYNSGGMPGYDGSNFNQGTIGFLTALATTQLESGLRPDQIGLGLPATSRAAGGGYQNPSNVTTAIESLVYGKEAGGFTPPKAYANLRGAMTWSINWDASNNYEFANTVSKCLDKLPPLETGETTKPTDPVDPVEPVKPTEPEKPAPLPGNTERLMIGYWHTWGGNASGGVPFVKLRDVDPNWDVINISFAEPVSAGSTDGKMKFEVSGLNDSYTKDDFKADIKALQAQGKKVVLAIGGYEGYFSLTSDMAVNQFVSDIKGFVDEYGFDGIDIDLEQSSVQFDSGNDPDINNPKSPKIVNMIEAIRQIVHSYGDDFILSWAPETFYMQLGYAYYGGTSAYADPRSGVYLPMINALREETSFVHVQLYNSAAITAPDGKSYSMGNEDAVVAMCKMLLEGFETSGLYATTTSGGFFKPLRPDQVVIAVPCSPGAAGSGQIANSALQSAFTKLDAAYPGMRGIMSWSINWDAYQNNDSFAKENGAFLHGTAR